MTLQRLQKFLASAGIASRRHCEALILVGRVAVNGRVVSALGTKVDPERDRVTLDGQPVETSPQAIYLLLHKPPGYVTTADDERGRPTVTQLLPPSHQRVFPVGRLDMRSEGLLLLTNDGEVAHRLTHPRYGTEREYQVLLEGTLSSSALAGLRRGIAVEGRHVTPVSVEPEKETRKSPAEPTFWLRIVLREGRKHEVRELCRAAGYPVQRLIRVRYGPLSLGRLPLGEVRSLSRAEVAALKEIVNKRRAGAGKHAAS